MHGFALVSATFWAGLASGAPTVTKTSKRGILDGLAGGNLLGGLTGAVGGGGNTQGMGAAGGAGGLAGGLANGLTGAASGLILNVLNAKPTATPASVSDALTQLNTIVPNGQLQLTSIQGYTSNGFVPPGMDLMTAVTMAGQVKNANNKDPPQAVFPKKSQDDAPYSLSENQLRSAINIPDSFTYGDKPPVIMVPGTGSTGDLTFQGNFMKALANKAYADPVTLNVPNFLLDDAQTNAEYVAYAMNYMSAVSKNQNVSVIAWSQGNIDAQWALKYWPSTRAVTSDMISVSPDFKGTTLADLVGPAAGLIGGTSPSVLQQASSSNFIKTLRADGGDSAYVPTTSVYSATDEIVQPQTGDGASAILGDARNVGVTNVQVQQACAGQPAGMQYLHEGMLFNPMAMALAMDALQNPGPGQMSRIDVKAVCSQQVGDGLDTPDVLSTSGNIPVAVVAVLMQQPNQKVSAEPAIKDYAAKV